MRRYLWRFRHVPSYVVGDLVEGDAERARSLETIDALGIPNELSHT